MAKRRKHLSLVHRRKISRGLKRYYRQVRERRERRALAGRKAWQTRKARQELRRIERTREVKPVATLTPESEEWEVTLKYTVGRGKHHGEVIDVTLRLVGRPGQSFTPAQVRAAGWYAVRHGLTSLSQFAGSVMDWRNTRRSGGEVAYTYEGADADAALENARGLFNTVGIGALRVGLVE